jgi:hypothetical protein
LTLLVMLGVNYSIAGKLEHVHMPEEFVDDIKMG